MYVSPASCSWILGDVRVGSVTPAQRSSSLTVGEKLCFACIPLIAIVEALVHVVTDCFDHRPSFFRGPAAGQNSQNFAELAQESRCFTVNEVEALYELYKKLSNSIITDNLIHKEELQLALFNTRAGENLFLDRVFYLFDEKKDGVIRFEEFVHSLSFFHPFAPLEDKINFTFKLYDVRQSGFIEREGVKQMVVAILRESDLAMTDDLLEAILDKTFAEVDTDKDDKINVEEWKEFVKKHPNLLRNMTIPHLLDITTVFPSFVFNTEVEDEGIGGAAQRMGKMQ